MTGIITFALGALALLATPGPTNTLLATAGATRGIKASLPLLAGEAAVYIAAILVLRALIGPVVATEPLYGHILTAVVCLYLLHLALSLWRQSDRPPEAIRPVMVANVFLTTLLNPKAIIFAFALMPPPPDAPLPDLAPWLGALTVMIAIVGLGWICLGAAIRHAAGKGGPQIGYRLGAVALAALATLLGTTAAGIV